MKAKNIHKVLIRLVVFSIPLFMLFSCNVARHLDKNEKLIVKNDIQIDEFEGNEDISESDLRKYIKQKPNKKLLFLFRFHTSAYNWGYNMSQKDSTDMSGFGKWFWKRKFQFRQWLIQNGEAPAILDTVLSDRTVEQLEYFLFTKGYFNAEAERMFPAPKIGIPFFKGKRVVVTYIIYPGKPYYIQDTTSEITSQEIKKLVDEEFGSPILQEGDIYDEKVLQNTRDRLNRLLKDSGFFYFNKAYVLFEVDSNKAGNNVNINLRIEDQHYSNPYISDSVMLREHKRCRISRVFVNPQYTGAFDQGEYKVHPVSIASNDTSSKEIYYFLYNDEPDFYTRTLLQKILITPGDIYCLKDVELTYNYLSELLNFRYTGIEFKESTDTLTNRDSSYYWLDCYVNLSRLPKQFYEFLVHATNTSGEPGLSVDFVYMNRNLLKGAEVLNLTINGALEVQKIIDDDQQDRTIFKNLPFNTMEYGAELSLLVPKFLVPVKQQRFPKSFKPKTSLIAGLNYQERPDYRRYITKISFGYRWQYSNTTSFNLKIPEFNSVSIFPDQSFLDKLEALNDLRLTNSYSDHIIAAINGTVRYSNQKKRNNRNYTYVMFNIESAGALLNAFRDPLKYPEDETGRGLIFHIPYAQYIRFNANWQRYFNINTKQIFALRTSLGLGIPYGNMDVLPFEKSFFVGGANGIRAWPIRTIGPGSFSSSSDTTRFDKTGDIGFEASFEYRFPIYSMFNGAIFFDAGNVWLKNKNNKFPNGEFSINRFYKELALGTGLGLRLDFSIFIIRLDGGIKIHDPSLPENERWRHQNIKLKHINWNFAIGYPF